MEQKLNSLSLENPITQQVVDNMIQQVQNITRPYGLLIDYGKHEFESLDVLKYCKSELVKIETWLRTFRTITIFLFH